MNTKEFRSYRHSVMIGQIKSKMFFMISILGCTIFICFMEYLLLHSLQLTDKIIILVSILGFLLAFYFHWKNCLPYGDGSFLNSILGLNATFVIYHIGFFLGIIWFFCCWIEQGQKFIDICLSIDDGYKLIIMLNLFFFILPSYVYYILCKINIINPKLTREEKLLYESNEEKYYEFLREKRTK